MEILLDVIRLFALSYLVRSEFARFINYKQQITLSNPPSAKLL